MSFLKDIVKTKKDEVQLLKEKKKEILDNISKGEPGTFLKSISKDNINVIAEIKKASPSMGVIRKDVDFLKIAKIYEENGAGAISVLTDKQYFQGDIVFLEEIKKISGIPILRKDFIIDELQIYEARKAGADAILLIAAILSAKQLKNLIKIARELGLDFILEIHDEDDLKKALKTDSEIIGINNRDLKTFKINLNTALKLYHKIPGDRKIIVESGISALKDIQLFTEIGINTFLIGKYLMEQNDPGIVLKSIKNASV